MNFSAFYFELILNGQKGLDNNELTISRQRVVKRLARTPFMLRSSWFWNKPHSICSWQEEVCIKIKHEHEKITTWMSLYKNSSFLFDAVTQWMQRDQGLNGLYTKQYAFSFSLVRFLHFTSFYELFNFYKIWQSASEQCFLHFTNYKLHRKKQIDTKGFCAHSTAIFCQ